MSDDDFDWLAEADVPRLTRRRAVALERLGWKPRIDHLDPPSLPEVEIEIERQPDDQIALCLRHPDGDGESWISAVDPIRAVP
jgi:hypothetical protein